jgi:hypothetical protein
LPRWRYDYLEFDSLQGQVFIFFHFFLLALYQAAEHGPWAEIVFAFVYGVGTRLCGTALPRIGGVLLMTSLSLVSKIPEPRAHLLICIFFPVH